MLLQTIPVERTVEHDILGEVRGTKDQPTDRRIHAVTRDFSTLIRKKCHGSSRPDPHETRISRVTRIVAGRVGSGQEDFKISRVGSGRVKRFSKSRESGRVGSGREFSKSRGIGSGRVWRFSKSRGSGRVGSRRLEILACWVGSGQDVSKFSRVGSGLTRPDPRNLTRSVKSPQNNRGRARNQRKAGPFRKSCTAAVSKRDLRRCQGGVNRALS